PARCDSPSPDLHRRPRTPRARRGDRECECGADDRPGDRARHAGRRADATDRVTQATDDPRAPCQCETFARVTERAALAGARWLGRADMEAAEDAAFSGARLALERMPIDGHVVIGAHEDAEQLAVGTAVGAGGEEFDLALDPLEGRAVVARGGTNAVSMIAAAPRGSMPSLPEMYMRKMAVGPVARGRIALGDTVGDNIRSIADAFGRMVNDITAIVLDRPRHHDL